MIEKILDKYYTKKLIEKLDLDLKLYCLDTKYNFEKEKVSVYIKKKYWNDKNYVYLASFYYKETLEYIVNYKYMELLKDLAKYIKAIFNKKEGE